MVQLHAANADHIIIYHQQPDEKIHLHTQKYQEKGLQPNPDAASIQEDDWEFIKQAIRYNGYGGVSNVKKGIRLLRNVKQIKKKDWTDETKADFIYNYYHFALMTDPKSDCNNELFIVYFKDC